MRQVNHSLVEESGKVNGVPETHVQSEFRNLDSHHLLLRLVHSKGAWYDNISAKLAIGIFSKLKLRAIGRWISDGWRCATVWMGDRGEGVGGGKMEGV